MAPTTMRAAGLQATATADPARVGTFMLTLCRLDTPVAIRPPQTPQLARFKFFMSRSRYVDGNERLHLHMGYFSSREEAEKCALIMRARFPEATVTALPPGASPRGGGSTQIASPARGQPPQEPPVLNGITAAEAGVLTDTQVLHILETRRAQPDRPSSPLQDRPEISLLRPEDTSTRRALKDALVQGTPVSFAIQLCQSDQPIQLNSLPALDIFRAYKLYLAEGDHGGRPWHALRLGFFSDAVSAKQVAYYARTSYSTVAVVPIEEQERGQASKKPIALTLLGPALETSIDAILAADQAASTAEEKSPQPTTGKGPSPHREPPRQVSASPKARPKDGLEQTLELLAASELWSNSDSDSFSETGVRHLKVEVQKRSS
jgi:hypothetical protein